MLSMPLSIMVIEDDNDRTLMEYIFNNYQRLMYYTIFRIVNDPWLAEDLMQSTIENLINSIEKFRNLDKSSLIGYVASASRNTAISHLRSTQRKHQLVIDDWAVAEEQLNNDTPEIILLKKEEMEAFISVWDRLDERSRFILHGRYVLKKTYSELGIMLGIKPDSARMAVTRARRTALMQLKRENKN